MQITGSIRVAIATLALASTVVTTMVTPLSALAAQIDPANPSPTMPRPQPTTVTIPINTGPRLDMPLPLPDVSVVTVGHSGTNVYPDYLVVAFNVQTAKVDANVNLTSQCTYRKLSDTNSIRNEAQPAKSMALSASWPVPIPVTVNCVPNYNEFVSSVYLKADVPAGDSNPSNNIATWDHITNK